jgi:EmrB/QacA subfamily drug resistance transporter
VIASPPPQAPIANPPAPAAAVLTSRRKSMAVLCAGFLMVILDGTVVSVALPTIADNLGLGPADLAWVVNAYLVGFGGLLLLAGRVGDLIGRRRMFMAGLAVFTFASLLCGLAQTSGQLIGARFVQGAGGAMSSAVILGMVVALFPEPAEKAQAFSVYAFVGATGASLGLVAGGILTDALDWRWIFLVNLPIGIATLAFSRKTLDADPGLGLEQGADVPGAMLIVAALMVTLYAIVGVQRYGLASTHTMGLLAIGAALLAAFVACEARTRTPLVPLRLFRTRTLTAANAVQLFMIAGFFGQQFMVALYLQRVLGFNAAEVGLGMLPIAAAIGATSLGLAARLIGRLSARGVLLAGMSLAAVSLAVLARSPAEGSYVIDVLPALVALGVGGGLSMPALTTIAMSDTPPAEAGLASGLYNTTQQVASSIGFAVLATLAATHTEKLTGSGHGTLDAFASGYGRGFLAAAIAVLVALALAVILLPRRRA